VPYVIGQHIEHLTNKEKEVEASAQIDRLTADPCGTIVPALGFSMDTC